MILIEHLNNELESFKKDLCIKHQLICISHNKIVYMSKSRSFNNSTSWNNSMSKLHHKFLEEALMMITANCLQNKKPIKSNRKAAFRWGKMKKKKSHIYPLEVECLCKFIKLKEIKFQKMLFVYGQRSKEYPIYLLWSNLISNIHLHFYYYLN